MKEKIKKEYLRKPRKLLDTKIYSRNLVKVINTKATKEEHTNEPENKKTNGHA